VLSCTNHAHPCRWDSTVLLCVFPCQKDDYLTMSTMAERFAEDLEELWTSHTSVRGATRSVRLMLTGAYAFETTFLGHSGASGSMPCAWCCALVRPTATHVALIDKYGTPRMEDGPARRRGQLNTLPKWRSSTRPGAARRFQCR